MICFQELKVKAVLSFTLSSGLSSPLCSCFSPFFLAALFDVNMPHLWAPWGLAPFMMFCSYVLRSSPVPDLYFCSLVFFPAQCWGGLGRMHTTYQNRQLVELGEGVGFTLWSLHNTVKKYFSCLHSRCKSVLKEFKIFSSRRYVHRNWHASKKSVCLHVMHTNMSEVYLQVALILYVRTSESYFVLWPSCTSESLVSVLLSPQFMMQELLDSQLEKFQRRNKIRKHTLKCGSFLMPKELLSLLRCRLIFPLLGASVWAAASKNNKKP